MALSRTLKVILSGDDKKLDKSLTRAERRLAKFERAAKFAAVGAASLAGVMAVKAVNAAVAYEESLSKLESQLGLTKPAVAAIGKEVNNLSRKVAISNVELAGAAFAIQSAGLRGKEAGEALEIAGKLAAAGLGEARTLGLTTAAAITAYGAANLSAAQAGDVLIATVKEGNLEASELAASLGQALPISSALGVSFAEVGASIAHYTRLGVSAGQATTGVRAAMQSLLKPSRTAQEGLRTLGLQATDLKLLVDEHGLVGALNFLRQELGNDVAFSKFLGSTEALSFALSVTGQNAEGFGKTLDGVTNSAGATEAAFDAASQTTAFAMRQLREDFNVLATQIGTELLPAIRLALDHLIQMVDAIRLVFQAAREQLQDTDDDVGFLGQAWAKLKTAAEIAGKSMVPWAVLLADKMDDVSEAAADAVVDMEALRSKASAMPSVLAALATDAEIAETAVVNMGLGILDASRQMADGKKELIAYGAAAKIMGVFFNATPDFEAVIAGIQGQAVRAIAALSQGLGSADTQSRIAQGIIDAGGTTSGIVQYTSTRRTPGTPATPTDPKKTTSTTSNTDDEAKPDTIDPARLDRAQFLGGVLQKFAKYSSDFTADHLTQILGAYQDDQALLRDDALAYYGRAETDAQAMIDSIAGGFEALITKADLDKQFTADYQAAVNEAGKIAHQDSLDQLAEQRKMAVALTERRKAAVTSLAGSGSALTVLNQARKLGYKGNNLVEALRIITNAQAGANVSNLAAGGVVPATPGGRLVRVGEGGQDEAIVPLGRRGGVGGGNTYNFTINAPGGDPNVIADAIFPALQQLERNGAITRVTE